MTAVLVAVPVLRGKRRFHIDKGRPWSVVEHLVLFALSQKPMTAAEVAEASGLHRRVVVEIIIRLMRVGWAEVSNQGRRVTFRASTAGQAVVGLDDLPAAPKRITRWMSFLIDQVTGVVFRSRELSLAHRNDVQNQALAEPLVWLEPRNVAGADDIQTVASVLLDEDERLAFVEASGERLVDRYALISVRDQKLEKALRLPPPLERAILDAAAAAPATPKGPSSPRVQARATLPIRHAVPPLRASSVTADDILIGGAAHWDTLQQVIRRARRRLIVHSCFITTEGFDAVRTDLLEAARRGVAVDILWGQNPSDRKDRSTADVVTALGDDPALAREPGLRIHPISTRSHSKFVAADDSVVGRHSLILGSCNWLSSIYNSVDVSVRVRDPTLVGDLLFQLAELSKGDGGAWSPVSMEFAGLASQVAAMSPPTHQRSQAQIVIGPGHGNYMREARDSAEQRILVTSHRLSQVANAAVMAPVARAVQARGIRADILYAKTSGAATPQNAGDLAAAAAKMGVGLHAVDAPRLHAKVLAWDQDHALITSQNWLSMDSNWNSPAQEIGLYLAAPDAGLRLFEAFDAILDGNNQSTERATQ